MALTMEAVCLTQGLGLPELQRTQTRRALSAVFELYREYRLILRMNGIYPSTTQRLPISLDKPGQDPATIHAQGSNGSSTFAAVVRKENLTEFVRNLEGKVDSLPEYQSEIIWRRYMSNHDPLPSDDQVWMELCEEGWAYSTRYYDKKKTQALMMLAYALHIEQEA